MFLFIIASIAFGVGAFLDARSSLGKRELMPFFRDKQKIFSPVRYALITAGFWVLFFVIAKISGAWAGTSLAMIPAIATRVFISIRNRKIAVARKL